jgi:hypothetical protein
MAELARLPLARGTADELAEAQRYAWQIRNPTRLARTAHPGGEVTPEPMREVLATPEPSRRPYTSSRQAPRSRRIVTSCPRW